MRRIEFACAVLAVALFSALALKAQTEPKLATRIIQALQDKEPCWNPVVGIEGGRVPVVPSEKTVIVASWYCKQAGGSPEGVAVSVYQVESTTEAKKWLQFIGKGRVAQGWTVRSYHIGDEGYLAEYRAGERFQIAFRKGSVVGRVAASKLSRVEEFIQIVLAEVPAK